MTVRALLLCLTVLLAAPAGAQPAKRDKVRLTTGEFPPFAGKTLPHQGLALRIVREAFDAAGIDVEYVFLPWKRAYESAKRDEFDGSAYWGLTPERQEHFHASASLFPDRWVFFHRKDFALEWKTLADLRGKTIGATLEYTYTPEFHALAKAGTLTVQWVPTDAQNLQKLLLGRVQLVPLSLDTGYHMLRTALTPEQAAQLTHHPRDFYSAKSHLLLAKRDPRNAARMERFERALAAMHASGSIERYFSEARKLPEPDVAPEAQPPKAQPAPRETIAPTDEPASPLWPALAVLVLAALALAAWKRPRA